MSIKLTEESQNDIFNQLHENILEDLSGGLLLEASTVETLLEVLYDGILKIKEIKY